MGLMMELDLNAMNEALYRLKNSDKARDVAEAAFAQAHKFSNEHLHVVGPHEMANKSEIVSMILNDMSDEILSIK